MRRSLRPIALSAASLAALGLAACQTAQTVYAPQGPNMKIGFTETQIEQDRYVVRFDGGKDASRGEVEAYALRRAAELTRAQNRDWFRVVSQQTETDGAARSGGPNVGVSAGGGSGSRGGFGGVGVGVGFNLGGGNSESYSSRLEILTGSGPQPADGNVYDARSVLSTVATN